MSPSERHLLSLAIGDIERARLNLRNAAKKLGQMVDAGLELKVHGDKVDVADLVLDRAATTCVLWTRELLEQVGRSSVAGSGGPGRQHRDGTQA